MCTTFIMKKEQVFKQNEKFECCIKIHDPTIDTFFIRWDIYCKWKSTSDSMLDLTESGNKNGYLRIKL